MKTVTYENGQLKIKFTADDQKEWKETLHFVKSLIAAEFHKISRYWTAAASKSNIKRLMEFGFDVHNDLILLMMKPVRTTYTDIKINEALLREKDFREYQIEGVKFLEFRKGRGGVFDDMGLGKTYQGIGFFMINPKERPVLVVCRSSAKVSWARHIASLLGETYSVLRGLTPYDLESVEKTDWYIINYDILAREDPEEKKAEAKRKALCKAQGKKYRKAKLKLVGWIKALKKLNIKYVIGDEIQAISNSDAVMSRAFIELAKKSKIFIPLSGTPIRNRPKDFFNVLNLLDPKTFPDNWKYLQRYCDPRHNGFGWEYNGATNQEELHELIKPLMIRRLKSEVAKELPPLQNIIEPMELDEIEMGNYERLDLEFIDWLKEHENKPLQEKEYLTHLKQRAYLAKRNSVIQWIKDYLENGNKLVVFAYHRKVIEDLYQTFEKIAVQLYGGTSEADRQHAIDSFQNDPKCKLFIGQTTSAGDSITLTAAPAVAFVEYPDTATQVRQCADRIHRIGQDAESVFAYHLIASGTIEEDITKMIQEKYDNFSLVLDGKKQGNLFGEDFDDFHRGLLKKYRGNNNE